LTAPVKVLPVLVLLLAGCLANHPTSVADIRFTMDDLADRVYVERAPTDADWSDVQIRGINSSFTIAYARNVDATANDRFLTSEFATLAPASMAVADYVDLCSPSGPLADRLQIELHHMPSNMTVANLTFDGILGCTLGSGPVPSKPTTPSAPVATQLVLQADDVNDRILVKAAPAGYDWTNYEINMTVDGLETVYYAYNAKPTSSSTEAKNEPERMPPGAIKTGGYVGLCSAPSFTHKALYIYDASGGTLRFTLRFIDVKMCTS
jgi:hypothetical protein